MDSLVTIFLISIPKFIIALTKKSNIIRSLTIHVLFFYFFPFITFLKKHSLIRVDQLVDICVVDHPTSKYRFEFFYIFISSLLRQRFFIRTYSIEFTNVPSLVSLFKNAMWPEREVWDMFGIFFYDHPDLRRILTDYGFDGFPLRKDFPLSGYIELRYDDEKMHIVYELLELSQNFRYFRFLTPWETVTL